MMAREPIAGHEALDAIKGTLGDAAAALLTVQQLAVMGNTEGHVTSAVLLHDAIARILDGLIPRLWEAHAAALRIGAAT
jgi:hypothetical protein